MADKKKAGDDDEATEAVEQAKIAEKAAARATAAGTAETAPAPNPYANTGEYSSPVSTNEALAVEEDEDGTDEE